MGRRRTSPQGRNRGAWAGYFNVPEYYGDLNGHSGVVACHYSVVSGMNPVFTVYQAYNQPTLCAKCDDKIVILKGSAKTALYRFLPVTK